MRIEGPAAIGGDQTLDSLVWRVEDPVATEGRGRSPSRPHTPNRGVIRDCRKARPGTRLNPTIGALPDVFVRAPRATPHLTQDHPARGAAPPTREAGRAAHPPEARAGTGRAGSSHPSSEAMGEAHQVPHAVRVPVRPHIREDDGVPVARARAVRAKRAPVDPHRGRPHHPGSRRRDLLARPGPPGHPPGAGAGQDHPPGGVPGHPLQELPAPVPGSALRSGGRGYHRPFRRLRRPDAESGGAQPGRPPGELGPAPGRGHPLGRPHPGAPAHQPHRTP